GIHRERPGVLPAAPGDERRLGSHGRDLRRRGARRAMRDRRRRHPAQHGHGGRDDPGGAGLMADTSGYTRRLPSADLDRVRREMVEEGFDALLPFTVDNVRYLTGHAPANPKLKGIFSALFCADASLPAAFVVGQFEEHWARQRSVFPEVHTVQLWVEIDDLGDLEGGTTS